MSKKKPMKTNISELNPKIDSSATRQQKEFKLSIEKTNRALYKRIKPDLKKD